MNRFETIVFSMSSYVTYSVRYAILNAKCPQCRRGNMFKYKLWNLTKFYKFHILCPVCNLRFDIEPGFFIGAMYISYAMIVIMIGIIWFVLYFIFRDPQFEVYIAVIFSLNLVLLPVLFRYSRVIYLHAFGGVKYNDQFRKELK